MNAAADVDRIFTFSTHLVAVLPLCLSGESWPQKLRAELF